MNKSRAWFWKIEEVRQGPDYIFIATFSPDNAQNLAKRVCEHLPAGFVHDTEFLKPEWRGDCHSYELYVDRHTYQRLMEMRDSKQQANIWYYAEIAVCDHELTISNILAARNYGETELIVALAQSPDLTLQAWKVCYAGYGVGDVACGTDAASLLDYLQEAA